MDRQTPDDNNSDAKAKDDYAEAVKISGDPMASCDTGHFSVVSHWSTEESIGVLICLLLSTKYPWALLVVALNMLSFIANVCTVCVMRRRLEQHDLAGARKARNIARVLSIIVIVTQVFFVVVALIALTKFLKVLEGI